MFFRPYFQFRRLDWIKLAIAISGSDCSIDYEYIMNTDLYEIAVIFDTLCKRQEKIERDMKRK